MITLNAVLPIFIVIMSGYFIRRHFIQQDEFWKQADRLVYYILLPITLFKTTSDFSYEPSMLKVGFLVFGLVTVMGAIAFLLRFMLRMTGEQFTSVFQGIVRPNFYISLSMASLLYGKSGVQFLAFMLVFLIFSATVYSVLVLDRYGSKKSGGGFVNALERLARNPIILSTVSGFFVGMSVGSLPEFAGRTLDVFGDATLPLALLGVGASLKFSALRAALPLVAVTSVTRLVLAPAICLLVGVMFGLNAMELTCCVLLFAVPAAASSITFASQMGGDMRLMSQILTFETVCSFVTLSLVIYLAQSLAA